MKNSPKPYLVTSPVELKPVGAAFAGRKLSPGDTVRLAVLNADALAVRVELRGVVYQIAQYAFKTLREMP